LDPWDGINIDGLRKEVIEAKELYLAGIKHSDDYRQEKTQESISMLEDFCKKNGKKLLKFEIHPEQENPDNDRDENGIDISGYDGFIKPKQ